MAIKTIAKSSLDEGELQHLLARFRHEAQTVGRLAHPGIVQIFDYGEDDELAYIVMELVHGKTLHEHLLQHANYDLREVGEIIRQLLGALGHAHAAGVVHRDVKPSNIMINQEGRIKIGDFGIAHTEASELTQHGDVLGTPHYMAPEQFLGLPIGVPADLYAVGVIAYDLVTGAKPFVGTTANIMQQVLNQRPADASNLNPKLSPLMDQVLQQRWRKSRRSFPSAPEFALRSVAPKRASTRKPSPPSRPQARSVNAARLIARFRGTSRRRCLRGAHKHRRWRDQP